MTLDQSFSSLHKAAIEAHLRNEFSRALELYQQCVQLRPNDPLPRHNLGLMLIQNGHVEVGEALLAESDRHSDQQSKQLFEHNRKALRGEPSAKIETDLEFDDSSARYQPFSLNTVGDWRHKRMLEFATAFSSTNHSWLTVGDHYGHDAKRLAFHGVRNITVSSLSTVALEEAARLGEVSRYLSLNAERMDLADQSFDYVVCKESLHHMPRPYLAIYEMLRIARRGVFFIEPTDPLIDWSSGNVNVSINREFFADPIVGSSVRYLDQSGKKIMEKFTDWWEDGPFNYVYTLSKREIKKIALGHGLPAFGTLGLNDFYHTEWNGQSSTENSPGFEETKRQIALYNQLCQTTGIPYNYTIGMLFRETPTPEQMSRLQQLGSEISITRSRFLAIKLRSGI
jgi:ubiquinone/menaquinone biosynthesis C-methylase UbiE